MKKLLALILAFAMLFSLVGCGKSEAVLAAEEAIEAIGEVSLDSEEAISKAETAIAALSEEELKKFDGAQTVEQARADYEALVAAEDAKSVDALIEKIGTVTLESEAAIADARAAYEALTDEAKKKVAQFALLEKAETDFAAAKAQQVADMIAAIGTVTLEAKEQIESARAEVNKLSAEEQSLLNNLTVLTDAESTLVQLETEANEKKLAELKGKFDIDEDKVQGITWYTPKSMPEYINTRSYLLPYIGVNNYGAWICIRYNYTDDDWIFWKTLTIMVDGEKDYKLLSYYDVTRDNDYGDVWENYDEGLDINATMEDGDIVMLRKIADSEETIVRFEGDDYFYDLTVSKKDKQVIDDVLAMYELLISKK